MLAVPLLLCGLVGISQRPDRFSARLPFPGGSVIELLAYRASVSGRGQYIAQIVGVTGVGPLQLIGQDGTFGGISNPYWELYKNGSSSTTNVPGQPARTTQIDVFSPKILCHQDYMGVLLLAPKGEQSTVVYKRFDGLGMLNLKGKFRLKELEKFGFSKKIVYPYFVANHEYFVSVASVSESSILRGIALAGGLKFTESQGEYRFEVDGVKLRDNLIRSRQFYGLDDASDYFSARIALKFKFLNRMTVADLNRVCKESETYSEVIDSRHPLYSDVQKVIDLNLKDANDESKSRLKNRLSVRVSAYQLLNVNVELELQPGKYFTL